MQDHAAMQQTGAQRRKPARWGLQGKLILSMLLVGVVPLLVGLAMAFYGSYEEIRQLSGTNFKAIAEETARKLDLVLGEEITRTRRIARDPAVVSTLEQRRDLELSEQDRATLLNQTATAWEAGNPEVIDAYAENELADLLRRYYTGPVVESDQHIPVVTRAAKRALFVTDVDGVLVASINAQAPFLSAGTDWWQGAYHNGVGQPYISNIAWDDRYKVYTFSLSLPVMDSLRYEAIGVLHQVYDAKEFLAPSVQPIRFGRTGHVMLIDTAGTVITCPILPTGTRVSDERVIELVTGPQADWVKAPSDGHGDQHESLLASIAGAIIGYARLPETSRITLSSTQRAWHTFVWQSSDELFAPVQHLLSWISVFGVVAVGLLVTLGYMAAGRIATPIRRLQEAAQLIGKGEFKEPISIKTGDEIEDLADEINRMNAQLEAAFAGLTDQVEEKTREVQYLQENTREILDSMAAPLFILDPEGRIHHINRAAREAFGLREQDLQKATLLDLLPLNEVSRRQLETELEGVVMGPLRQGAAPSGQLAGGMEAGAIRDPLKPRVGPEIGQHRKEIQIGPCIYRHEWFRISGQLGHGGRIGLILRNVTDESRRQDQLIQAEKLGSLGVLTAGIGHELNNPLFGILGLGEAIQDETDPEKIKGYARDIVQQGKRMASTIKDFTGLARAESRERYCRVDIIKQLDQALKLAPHGDGGADLQIETRYGAGASIRAIPEELRQVFVNVIENALQAMHNKGKLSIATQVADGRMEIRISDTGPGIPQAFLSKVFDPFFTTKGQGEGSGLGLTVANRLVTKYGGRISMQSEEGQGTTCVITFPLAEPSRTGERAP